MVGEISPDGNFIWNGVEWVPKDSFSVDVPNAGENLGNSAQVEIQTPNEEIGWSPVDEKAKASGKGKMIALSIVGVLVLSAMSWLMYAFVIDPMLFPDPYSKSKFTSVIGDQPRIDEVASGDAGSWICQIEVEMEEDGMFLRSYFDIYVSSDSARSYSKISAGLFGSASTDVWVDEKQIAWKTETSETSEKYKIPISGMEYSPGEEIVGNSTESIEMCFLHHLVAEAIEDNPSQKFVSDGERFPDEEGERAVYVETKMEIDGEDGEMNIAVFFDGDDNLLGTKIWNSTFECIVTFDTKSFSAPSWVSNANTQTPMLLELDEKYISSSEHNTIVNTQFNATYPLRDNEVKIVVYNSEYDFQNETDITTVIHEVAIEYAIDGGVVIQTTNWNDETVNCTINYVDQDLDGLISSGDYVSIDCEEDALNGFEIGISNEYGISVTVDMEVPWASPILTIIALLGAALLVSRRD